jgi:hypothetical protein
VGGTSSTEKKLSGCPCEHEKSGSYVTWELPVSCARYIYWKLNGSAKPDHKSSFTQSSSHHNGGTTHDETKVETKDRSLRVDIPPQSQPRESANVAAGVETGVDFEKTIAPGCRGSQSRGGRGRETCNSSLFFGRGRRSSVNGRQGDTTKEHQQADLLASSIVRTSRNPAREVGDCARVCAGHGGRARDRIEGATVDPAGKATTATDPAGKMTIRPKGRRI